MNNTNNINTLETMSREDLIKLCKMYAKNWLAHDGCWFLTLEERYGTKEAIDIDVHTWEKFSVVEAKRIMTDFDIAKGGGLESLKRALPLRLYATVNRQTIREEGGKLIFEMNDCRVQSARKAKGLPPFNCKEVGLVEYSVFARTIDPRIKTKCISCPPDAPNPTFHCAWEFWMGD